MKCVVNIKTFETKRVFDDIAFNMTRSDDWKYIPKWKMLPVDKPGEDRKLKKRGSANN